MTTAAILLVTISAFIHALWNLLGKRQNPSPSFFFAASAFAAICLSPVLLVDRSVFTLLPPAVWIYLGLTSVFELVYYIGLAGAYRHGDMSLAYPLARALPVVWVAILTSVLLLGKPLNPVGVAGILAVALGCLVLPLRSLRQIRLADYLTPCCLLACLAALGTTGYTLVDNQVLVTLRSIDGIGLSQLGVAVFYLALQSVAIAVVMGIYVLITPAERAAIRGIWHAAKTISFVTGILIVGTYGLVLAAMTYATNVSYIAAFRQLSIPLGTVLGILVLKEQSYKYKLVGMGMIFGGLILIILA